MNWKLGKMNGAVETLERPDTSEDTIKESRRLVGLIGDKATELLAEIAELRIEIAYLRGQNAAYAEHIATLKNDVMRLQVEMDTLNMAIHGE